MGRECRELDYMEQRTGRRRGSGEVASYYIRVGPFCHELMFRMAAQVFPGYPAGRRLLRLQRGGQHLDYT